MNEQAELLSESEPEGKPQTDPEIEAQARKQGWKPEEEWVGEPPSRGFVTAEEFVEAGSNSLPLLTKRLHDMETKIETVEQENAKLLQQSRRYKEFTDKALANERKKLSDAIEEQNRLKAEAISESDGDKVLAAERKIRDLEAQTLQTQQPDTQVESWMSDNAWYDNDKDLRALADGISLQLRDENPALVGRAHLDELATRVKAAMPAKFTNPKREQAPAVESARRAPPAPAKSFENLPPESKKAYQDFKEMQATLGNDYTKEQYLANYEWDE